MLAANLGDDAKGAGVVTAFRNLEVGHVVGGEAKAGRLVVGDVARLGGYGVDAGFLFVFFECLAHDGGDVLDLVEADEGVYLGHESGEFLLEALGQAPGDKNFLLLTRGVFRAVVNGIDDGAD